MILRRLSEVPANQTTFVWAPFLPAGAISILEGPPGSLKSTLCADLAARVSSGRNMPEVIPGMHSLQGGKSGAILMAGEDDAGRIRAASKAAGAELDRIALVDRCCLREDLSAIETAAKDLSAKLIIIDPISDFVGQRLTDERATRDALQPLRQLAQDLNLSVVLVRHLVKAHRGGAISAGLGSIALAGVARSVILASQHPELPGTMVLSLTKSNVAAPVAFSYSAEITGGMSDVLKIQWGSVVNDVDSNTLLSSVVDIDSRSALLEAIDFLYGLLKDGPLPTEEVVLKAKRQGVSWSTVKRAKKRLGVQSYRRGRGSRQFWVFCLPQSVNQSMLAAKTREVDNLMEELVSEKPDAVKTSADTDSEDGTPA